MGKNPEHRAPARLPHKLTGPAIQIRPTAYGMVFIAVLAVMLVGSIRYNNNLGFLLSFLLGGMAIVSIRHTRRNLNGIQIVSCEALPVFAGESLGFELVADPGPVARHALSLAFQQTGARMLNLDSGAPAGLVLRTLPLKRGLFAPGPLKVSSRYPIGLFTAGAILRPDAAGLVYPRPREGPFSVGYRGGGLRNPGDGRGGTGADDFQGLRAYEPGDPLRHLSWKVFSRGLGLHTKEFVSPAGAAICLDWFRLSGMAGELRLERLCAMVLEAQKRHLSFGLNLPGKTISPGIGAAHGRRCLAELALFAGEGPPPAGRVGGGWKRPAAPDSDRWRVSPLLGALLVAFLPQMIRLPLSITSWCLILWGYMFFTEWRNWPRPNRAARWALTAVGIALVFLSYQLYPKGSFSIGMLAVMAGLKPVEVYTHRDRMVTVFLAYFLAITSLFDFESLTMTSFMFVSVLVTTAVMIRQNHPAGNLRAYLRLAAVIMVQAVPLMVILFVCFPRTYSSSWGLPGEGRGVTGFSDVLRSGDVSNLVRSDRVAFRAEFDGKMPPADRLYWRGVVFEKFDGIAWRPAKVLSRRRKPVVGDQPVTYDVSLEPYDGRWLFALDLPDTAPDFVSIMGDDTLRSRRRLTSKVRYRVTSVTRYTTRENPARRRGALNLPDGYNPRTLDLARRWKAEDSGPSAVLARALAYFSENKFVYTLSPPAAGENAVDDFLFESRQGFCEHYASALAVLMRGAGIPARIVGGFLGGEQNPHGNYLVVRDSHAHSWVEVWLDDRGWIRVDPTLEVAPGRAILGADGMASVGESAGRLLENLPVDIDRFLLSVRHYWEFVNTQWEFEVMGYSSDEQRDMLFQLGLRAGTRMTFLVMLLCAVLGVVLLYGGIFLWRTWTRRKRREPVKAHYAAFCNSLAAVGLARHPSQGPVDYARMVTNRRPDLQTAVAKIVDLYVRLRYGGDDGSKTGRIFVEQVRRFKPRKLN